MDRENRWVKSPGDVDLIHRDLIPGVSLIEICDRSRVLIENHKGIVAYGCCEIRVKVSYGFICVCGEHLKLSRMSKGKLVITGRICSVLLQGRG